MILKKSSNGCSRNTVTFLSHREEFHTGFERPVLRRRPEKLHRLDGSDLPFLALALDTAFDDLPPRLIFIDMQHPVELQDALLRIAFIADNLQLRAHLGMIQQREYFIVQS